MCVQSSLMCFVPSFCRPVQLAKVKLNHSDASGVTMVACSPSLWSMIWSHLLVGPSHSLPIVTIVSLISCQSGLCHTILLRIVMAGWVCLLFIPAMSKGVCPYDFLTLFPLCELGSVSPHMNWSQRSSKICALFRFSWWMWLSAIAFCIQLPFLAQTLAHSVSLSVLPLFVPMTQVYSCDLDLFS